MSFRLHHWLLVAVAGGFFAVALLPHRQPWLELTPAGFFYLPALPFVLLATCLLVAIALVAWIFSAGESRRRWLVWLATFTTILVSAGVTFVAHTTLGRGLPTGSFVEPFDGQVWRDKSSAEYVNGDITPRQKMLGAVIAEVVQGGDKESIVEQLGPPDAVSFFSELSPSLIYCTGPQRDSFFRIDSEWLLIWLDEQGRTKRYEIRSD